MITKILAATDGSPASNRALALATQLAIQNDASLHLLHVVRKMQVPPELKRMAEVENIDRARSSALEFVADRILSIAEQRATKTGAKVVRTATASGDPATGIIKHAKKNKIDLIVMGTRGLGGVKGLLLGSVSRKLLNTCEINCLIVR